MRQTAQLTPPQSADPGRLPFADSVSGGQATVVRRAPASIEELLPQLVRRIAWGGDRRRGTVQMELGAGRHAGAIVTVHADGERVRVEVQGAEVEELRARIGARLERHGLNVESVT